MTFDGFVRPTRNWFSMPNNWTDITAEIDNLAELKVVEYVARHTWGFHEFGITKTISIDEFMHGRRRTDRSRMDKGTGLKSDRSVKDGLKLAIEHGYLEYEVDHSDQGRVKKSYALKMAPPETDEIGGYNLPQVVSTPTERDDNRGVDTTSQGCNIYPPGVQHLPPRGATSTHRSEKDTLERNSRKIPKKEKIRNGAAIADIPPHILSELTIEEDIQTSVRAAIAQASLASGGHITEEMIMQTIAILGGSSVEEQERQVDFDLAKIRRAATTHTNRTEQEKVTQAITPTESGATLTAAVGGKEYTDAQPASNTHHSPRHGDNHGVQHAHSSVQRAARDQKRDPADERTQATRSTARKRSAPPIKPDLFESAPREVQAVITEWRAIFKHPIPTTAKLIEQATVLTGFMPVPGEIAQCRLWMYKNDTNGWYKSKGMHLADVAREFERFRSLSDIPLVDVVPKAVPQQAVAGMRYKPLPPVPALQPLAGGVR